MKAKIAIVFVAVMALTLLEGQHQSRADDESVTTPCVDIAMQRELSTWSCMGPILVGTASDGTPVRENLDPNSVPVDEDLSASRQVDDYDTWCESQEDARCTRRIGTYTAETQGNVFYGTFEQGVIGRFDVIIRTSLNGRQQRWITTIIIDEGPNLDFLSLFLTCQEEEPYYPDTNCGAHVVGFPYVQSTYRSPLIFGNRLGDESLYYAQIDGTFEPDSGVPTELPTIETRRFTCPDETSNCYYTLVP